MLFVFSELMGVPNPATYYTMELQPILLGAVSRMAPPDGNGAFAPRRLQVLLSASPIRNALLARRIVFVGGKGGVGKTTVAAALAAAAADRDRNWPGGLDRSRAFAG